MMKKIVQLLRDNASAQASSLQVLNADTDEVIIYLYDIIDAYWGVSAAQFNKELMSHNGKTVHLRINSPGGDVFEAEAMATMIKQHGNVIAHVDGLAASAATRIASAAKSVEISESGFYMIHNAWTFVYGNKNDFITMAELLAKIDGSIINDYVRKTGKSEAEIIAWMDAETWFTAQEALDNKFVDSIFTTANDKSQAKNKAWNLSAYANAPEPLTKPSKEPEPDIAALAQIQMTANKSRLQLLDIT